MFSDGYGIYKWTNLITGEVLVGQTGYTAGFVKRHKRYIQALRRGNYGNIYFQRSVKKYGIGNFLFEPIEEIPLGIFTIEEHNNYLTIREQFWLDYYRSLPAGVYNQVGPVNAPRRGARHSEETKIKMSIAKKGKPGHAHTQDWKDHMSELFSGSGNPQFGKSPSPETRAKSSKSHKGLGIGYKHTDESKIKMSIAATGRIKSDETRAKLSKALKGKPAPNKGKKSSPETRAKLSKIHKGKPKSEAQRLKMSVAAKARYARERAKKEGVAINQIP